MPTGDLRPPLLNPLFAPLTTLTGVGPAVAAAAIRLLQRPTPRCLDLLAHLPSGAYDPTPRVTLTGADLGQMVTLRVEIEGHRTGPRSGRAPHRILARVAGEPIDLVFFGARGDHLATRFPVGGKALLHGQLGRFGERWQIAHPEPIDEALAHNGMVPLYPLVQGLGHRRVRTLVRAILDRVPDLPEWLPAGLLRASGWTDWAESIRAAHRPATAADLEPISPARRRLAFDELVASQLALGLMRVARTRLPGRGLSCNGHLAERLINSLPFPLTDCQKRAIAEIGQDLASPAPMLRLLQGDVGSGKTVVAAASMLRAIEAGTQAALMAPTEVLTRQHGATLERLLAPLGLGIALLTGREPTARRRATLAGLATGEVAVAVGTQALLESGVGQRLDLVVKGHAVDVLLMTATPIPRSLVLTLYGDLASSHLLTKPPGRQPITTRALPGQRIEEVLAAIERALQRDERIYWICPLIEGGESDGATAAVERHRQLAELFDGWVGLIHGRLAGPAKAKALDAFAAGSTRLLVATTAIEVGVDVPEASIMVIEHAERFGLAQLHQLRGRVGRGSRPSFCLLLYEPPLGKAARTRIATLRRTEDGFRIAEEDLRLRGPGEVLGMRQSGLPSFRFADLAHHADLLDPAREVADRALAADPGLRRGKSEPLRVLLHLFERHDAVRLLAAG